MTQENQERVVPVSPDNEALKVLKGLRKELPSVPLSVSGYINKKGVRALHVACDHPDDESRRYDKRYPADRPTANIVRHAAKMIRAEFGL